MEETEVIPDQPGHSSGFKTVPFIVQFFEEEANCLMSILRSYVRKYQLVPNGPSHIENTQEMALELLHEVYIEAMKSYQRFDPTRPPRAWLLGIAQNIARRKKATLRAQWQHEILMSDLCSEQGVQGWDDGPLAHLVAETTLGPELQAEVDEQVEHVLSLASDEYRHLLRLSIIEGWTTAEVAEYLGCSHASAIVRLHRARKQLRRAIDREKGRDHGSRAVCTPTAKGV